MSSLRVPASQAVNYLFNNNIKNSLEKGQEIRKNSLENIFNLNNISSHNRKLRSELTQEVIKKAVLDSQLDNLKLLVNGVNEVKLRERLVKLLVWNMQTLNKSDDRKRVKKLEFILERIQRVLPDFVFLIDCQEDYLRIGSGYVRYGDGRNLLFIKNNIMEVPEVSKNLFVLRKCKLVFTYWVPNERFLQLEDVVNSADTGWIFCGDVNLKSNFRFKLAKTLRAMWRDGENSFQTGFMGSNVQLIKFKSIESVSDHCLLVCECNRLIFGSGCLRLKMLDQEIRKRDIFDLCDGFGLSINPKVVIKKENRREIRENYIFEYIAEKYINNHVEWLYSKYNTRWKMKRREPFLGKFIPDSIVTEYKSLMRHNVDKDYKLMFTRVDRKVAGFVNDTTWSLLNKQESDKDRIKIEDIPLHRSKSVAVTFELFYLKEIYDFVKEWIVTRWKQDKRDLVFNLLLTILNFASINRSALIANCFFLMKNPELKQVNHVRMIMISPVVLKIYEILIVNEVSKFIEDWFYVRYGAENYQFGAIRNMSTYKAMNRISKLFDELNADGILCLDIAQGYESVELDVLELFISEFVDNIRIKFLLINWIRLVFNMDIMINDTLVKRTKGLPMGLVLAPLMFIFYVDCIFRKNNISGNLITMYIDDLNILLFDDSDPRWGMNSFVFIETLIEVFKVYGLSLNMKKASAIVNSNKLDVKLRKLIPGIVVSKNVSFLGRLIDLDDNNVLEGVEELDDQAKVKPISNWNSLSMKRLVYEGGIEAKNRYFWYMISIKRNSTKERVLRRAYKFYKNSFAKTSYLMICLVSGNLARYFIDIKIVEKWIKQDCDIYKRIGSGKLGLKLSDLDPFVVDERATYILNALLVNVKQLDSAWSNSFNDWDKSFLVTNVLQYYDLWDYWKAFCEKVWNMYKRVIFKDWVSKHINDKNILKTVDNFPSLWSVVDSKFVKKFGFLLDLLLEHFERDKMSSFDLAFLASIRYVINYVLSEICKEEEDSWIKSVWTIEKSYVDFDNLPLVVEWDQLFYDFICLLFNINKYGCASFTEIMKNDDPDFKKKVKYYKSVKAILWRLFTIMDIIYRNRDFGDCNSEMLTWCYNFYFHNLASSLDELYDLQLFQEFKEELNGDGDFVVESVDETDLNSFGLL